MNAEQYIDYLIDAASAHARGDSSIGVQPSELAALKTIMASEKAKSSAGFPDLKFKYNVLGNPA